VSADPRRLAIDALVRIEREGAYANVAVPAMLARVDLAARDRGFVTELVYGTTRRRRALDDVLDRYLVQPPPDPARAALRIGAYQLLELGTPPHAAVSATVGAAPKRFRGLVNAVLRKVADAASSGVVYPDDATALSYPDWIVDRLRADLGAPDADRALAAMNDAATVHRRADGYVQDVSSQLVVAAVPVTSGDRVLDLCAAPGGKATGLADRGTSVIAADLRPARARLMAGNVDELGASVSTVVADGRHPPLAAGRFDAVLVDAPCSGLGALRRRPDARWRIREDAVEGLVGLQRELLMAAAPLVAAGGVLAYSVCTLTRAETSGVAEAVDGPLGELGFSRAAANGEPWQQRDGIDMLLPGADHDGMAMAVWRR